MPVPNLKENIKIYHAAGQSVEVHTNGSAAAEAYVAALEEAVAAYPDVNGYSSYLHSWPDHGTPACRTPLGSL